MDGIRRKAFGAYNFVFTLLFKKRALRYIHPHTLHSLFRRI